MPGRIIFTVTNDLSFDQRMQRICSTLGHAGFSVLLLGRRLPASKPLEECPYQQKRLYCLFKRGKLFYLEYNLRLFFYLLFNKADLIGAVDLDTIVPAFLAARLKGAKLSCDAHEYFPEVPEVVRRPAIQKVWRLVERTFLPACDLVYTVSRSIAEAFEKEYRLPVHTIRNLPVLRPFQQPAKSPQPYLLYQGALNEGRGLENLLVAMKEIELPLWLAGEGDLSQLLRGMVRDNGLEQKVIFLGMKRPEELRVITAQAYMGINLLENNGLSYYYSLANKFLDYIHAAIPQVCINFPEYAAINTQYNIALPVENTNPTAIAAAVNRLLNDKKLYNTLKQNCMACREELNWQRESKKLVALYEQILR